MCFVAGDEMRLMMEMAVWWPGVCQELLRNSLTLHTFDASLRFFDITTQDQPEMTLQGGQN